MADSGKKKRLVTLMGLMIVLVLGALWLAGNVMQSSRGSRKEAWAQARPPQPVVVKKKLSAPAGSAATIDQSAEPAMVRKKLPQPPPAPEPHAVRRTGAGAAASSGGPPACHTGKTCRNRPRGGSRQPPATHGRSRRSPRLPPPRRRR